MADGSVIFETELDSGGLRNGLSKLGGASAKWAGAATKGIGVALGAVTTGLGFLAKTAVSYNSQMENYTTNFGVMLGDEAKAVQHVAELHEMAAKTPFGMEDLANASQTMLAFGLGAEESMVAMQQLGDISLGNKERFNALSLAFSQVSAAGKLTGQDLLQMVNAGFNPLQTIAEKTGVNLGDLKEVMAGGKGSKEFRKQMKAAQKEVKKMGDQASEGAKMLAKIGEDGAISAEMIGWAMEIETSPGGRFYNGMLKASETFSGMMSTLQDDATAFVGKVFEPMTEKLTTSLLPLAQSYIDKLSTAFDEGGTDGVATAIGEVIADATTKAAESLPDVLDLSSKLLSKIATELTANAETIAGGLADAITAVATSGLPETAIVSIGTLATEMIGKLAASLSDHSTDIIGGIASGINKLLEGGMVGDLLTAAINIATGLVTGIAENLPETLPSIAEGIVKAIGAAFETIPSIAQAGVKLLEGLKKGLFGEAGTGGAIGEFAQEIIDGINGFFANNFPELKIKLPEWSTISSAIQTSWNSLLPNFETMLKTKLGINLPEFSELEEKAKALKDSLTEFFKIVATITLTPITSETENPFSETDDPFAYNVFEEAKFVNENYKETTWDDLWGELFPSAGAAELPPKMSSTNKQMAEAAAADLDAALIEAFKNGEMSYEELVAAKFGAPNGETTPTEGGEGENPMSAMASQIVADLNMGLQQDSGLVASTLSTVLSNAKSAADTSQFSSVGAQIAGGIAKGISNGTGVVVAAVKRLVQATLDAAEDAAIIESPSHLFRDRVGAMIARGMAVGVDQNAHLLRKATNQMVLAGVPDMSKMSARVAARYAPQNTKGIVASAANAGVFNQNNTFNMPVQTPDEFAQTMRIYATYGLQEG